MAFASRGFFGSQMYPTDASRFISVASGAGGAFTTTMKRALGYLVNGLSDLGIGNPGQNFLIYPFIGTTSTNNQYNLFSAQTSAFNLTFVGSPTHGSGGVTFNGTTQYATSISLAINDLGLTMANMSTGFCTTGIGAGTYTPIGFFMSSAQQTKTYSTAGSYTFNPNVEAPGVTSFTITSWGAGGAGGGSNATASNRPGGGGSGGGYATRAVTLTKAQGATNINITVGAGGSVSSGANGGPGGDSIVTHPNFTGIDADGGFGGNVNTAGAPGGARTAPTTSSGTTTFNGGTGAAGGAAVGNGGGGGGSSAGTAANGNAGTTPTTTTGGAGGTAPTNGVTGGQGGNGVVGGAGFAGNPGTAGGGGGGGAGATSGAPNNRAGGAGGAGKVTISWTATPFKRNTISIIGGTGSNQFDASVTTDNTSRFSYTTSPTTFNGVRVASRRANNGNSADMGFYIANNAATASAGPAIMSTTSYDPSPVWYIGAVNSWGTNVGNTPGNFFSGTLNFAFIGPALSNGQLQAMYTLITTYNTILGR
jgi:hypothetical protein